MKALSATFFCGTALAAVISPMAAHAQNAPDSGVVEIIVTANKRSETIQSIAASVSAISGDDLTQTGATQLDDALKSVAGVIISQGPTGLDPNIRGVGPSLPATVGGDNGISTTFDGVYNQANIAARAGYYDLARIEVLRGPQGTLYGRNAEGGAVNIITNDPTNRYEGAFSVNAGNYDLIQGTAMVNVPLAEGLAVRAAGSVISRDGYLSNGQDDNKAKSARIKLLYNPSDALRLLVGGEYAEFSGKGPGTVNGFATAPSDADTAYTSSFPSNQYLKRHGYKLWAQADIDAGLGTLTIIPAYQWLSAPDQLQNTGLTNSYGPGHGALKQRSVETRLASKSGSPFEWVAGFYYYDNDEDQRDVLTTSVVNGAVTIPAGQTPQTIVTSARSTALFAQVKVPITDALRLVGGLRHSWDRKTQFRSTQSTLTGKAKFDRTDWKAGVEFDLTNDNMLYATVSTGYRPGGLSPASNKNSIGTTVGATFPVFDSEELTSYEIGSKNELLDGRLRLNASLFRYDYKNYQVPNLLPLFVGGNFAGFDLVIFNLPKVVNWGGELELQANPTRFDRLTFSASYLNSEIKEPFVVTPQGVQIQGQPLPNSPKWRLSATFEHDFEFANGARLTPSVTARYSDSYYVIVPPTPLSNQEAYWQEDASLRFTTANAAISVTAYIKNLSNEVVKSNAIATRLTLQTPRTYGMTLSAKF